MKSLVNTKVTVFFLIVAVTEIFSLNISVVSWKLLSHYSPSLCLYFQTLSAFVFSNSHFWMLSWQPWIDVRIPYCLLHKMTILIENPKALETRTNLRIGIKINFLMWLWSKIWSTPYYQLLSAVSMPQWLRRFWNSLPIDIREVNGLKKT